MESSCGALEVLSPDFQVLVDLKVLAKAVREGDVPNQCPLEIGPAICASG